MFDTKIALVVREDLETWRKLNVTAFLVSGVLDGKPDLLGEPYRDAAQNAYARLIVQPIVVLTGDAALLQSIHRRALERGARIALYIDDMFTTGCDADNRAAMASRRPEEMAIAGIGLREERRLVDKIVKGARMHA